MINHKFGIGDELKDIVTSVSGVVMGITKYATGCIHYGLQSRADKKPSDWIWLDESQLILVKAGVVKFLVKENVASGRFPNAPNM